MHVPGSWKASQSGRLGRGAVHGLPMFPLAQNKPTSTRGGKGTGTGWAPATTVRPRLVAPRRKVPRKGNARGTQGAQGGNYGQNPPPPPPSSQESQSTQQGTQNGNTRIVFGGKKQRRKEFLPFKEALLLARSLKLTSKKEWEAWCKSGVRPANFPSCPHQTYKHEGWQGWGHWLGTGNVDSKDQQFLPFKKALLRARSLKLKNKIEWKTWCKSDERPANVSSCPESVYKHEGWQGWGHWLGTGAVAHNDRQFLPFTEALLHARSLKLKTQREWMEWCKSDARLPNMSSNPHAFYKQDGWQGYGHWLGTGNVGVKKDHEFLPFKKALLCARSLKLTGAKEWEAWCKSGVRQDTMPSHPNATYKHDGWQGYGHWLGTGNVGVKKDQQFLPFKKALLHARSLKLKGQKEWQDWSKSDVRPPYVPSRPDVIYQHDGWQGYGHWLGTGAVAHKDKQFLPFKEALMHARSLKLNSQKEWRVWCKSEARRHNIPRCPDAVYKHDGWEGYGHWLGTS